MTTTINIANSMIHPRNKEVTIDTFLKLKRAGEAFDPIEVRRWIISEAHWSPEDAQAVYDIASGIKSGKNIRQHIGQISGEMISLNYGEKIQKIRMIPYQISEERDLGSKGVD